MIDRFPRGRRGGIPQADRGSWRGAAAKRDGVIWERMKDLQDFDLYWKPQSPPPCKIRLWETREGWRRKDVAEMRNGGVWIHRCRKP